MNQLLNIQTPKQQISVNENLMQGASLKSENKSSNSDFLTLLLSQTSSQKLELLQTNTTTIDDNVASLTLEEATFAQILQLIEVLNGGEQTLNFPKLTDKIQSLLNSEVAMNELKNVKSMDDLMKLSTKYDLGLSNVKVTSEDVKQLSQTFPKLAENNFFNTTKEVVSSESLLKAKQSDVLHVEQKITPKSSGSFIDLKEIKSMLSSETKTEVKSDLKSLLDGLKSTPTVEVKTEQKVDIASLLKSEIATKKDSVGIQDVKNEAIKNLTKSSENSEIKDSSKVVATQTEEQSSSEDSSSNENNNTHLSREVIKNAQNKLNTNQLRNTFSTFAQDFKEQVESYKSPMTRVNMTLNPSNLGEVEVTLVTRGNNLQVSFTSTNQTLSLFVQNQAEFKNSLVNMGFTELEMSFNEKQKEQDQQQNKNKKYFSEDFEDGDELASLEMTLKNYA